MKLIEVGAVWCPSCLIISSRINKLVKKYNLEFINYDYDIDSVEVKKLGVGKILPELILVDEEDNEINRIVGEQSLKKLEEFIGE